MRIPGTAVLRALLLNVFIAASLFGRDATDDATSQARAIIQTELASKVPGLAIAVAVDDKMLWSEGFGYADLETKTPVTNSTRFRIGSVSKSLTAAGLALLVERGQLDMDAPVQKHIPDFPEKGAPITLRMLAGHISGIRNYRGYEAVSNKRYPDLHSGLKIFEDDPLISPPGTKFSYSSYNWNVIGAAMEAASKQEFLSFMKSNVFDPLGMTNTVPDIADAGDPQRAQFYETKASGEFVAAPKVDHSFVWPAGGFLSTAEDLVHFGCVQLGTNFLEPASKKLLFTSQKTADGKLTHYGVGWFIGQTLVYHGGDSIGGKAILMMLPASRTIVAIVCNKGHIIVGRADNDSSGPSKTDLPMPQIAHRIVDIFAPLHVKQ